MSDADRQLLDAWRDGNAEAGEELFARYFDRIYGFFRAKVAPSEVADLVQTVFVACVEGRDRFRGESSVRAYIFGVARNVLYRHYRTNARSPRLDFSVSSLHDLGASPSSQLRREEEEALLRDAVERLPLELQVLLELRFDEGLKGPELAVALEVPEGTVRSRLRRALEQLRDAMTSAAPPARQTLERWQTSIES